jgi:gluconate 5-dehydrogenase
MVMNMNKLFSVENLIVIITGSGKGIGHTLSESFADNGAIVYSISLNFNNEIPSNLKNSLFQEICDVRNKNKFKKICKKIYEKHGKIDVLINNAGITLTSSDDKSYSIDDWNKTLDVNLTAGFNCSNSVFEYMLKNNSGSIINITSINAELGFPKNPYYVASKGGLKMLTKALARDWGKYGIRVNNLGPGYFKTEMTKKSYSDLKKRKSRSNQTMLGRWGTTDELVGPAIFLASKASSYITGHDLYVDGGWIANGLSE